MSGSRFVRRLKKRTARLLGRGAPVRDRGNQARPTSSALLGALTDPAAVPDPFADAVPEGCIQKLARDEILPVYDPEFIPAREVTWDRKSLVIGLAIGTDVRAYPAAFLSHRELVLDRVGGVPVVVSWCPQCGTAMTYRRELDGVELIFGNQGAMCDGAMTWWDHDTGSVWSQPLGVAIAGARTGASLTLVPSTLTTWQAWRKRHPKTLGLRAHMGTKPRHRLRDLAVVVRVLGSATAYPMARVLTDGVINDTVGGLPIGVVSDPGAHDHWKVFSRQLNGHAVTLHVDGDRVIDVETRSSWDPVTGDAVSGPEVGNTLTEIAAFTALPEDFARLWPDGVVHD